MFELHTPALHSGGRFSLDEPSGSFSNIDQRPIILDCEVHCPDSLENVLRIGAQELFNIVIQARIINEPDHPIK